MNATVREWLDKANKDLASASLEIGPEAANFDLVCFLAQQSAEKLLKAALIAGQVIAPKTHNLVWLRVGKWTQQDGVHYRKDRRRCPDSERQR